jgi:hypothetical protein
MIERITISQAAQRFHRSAVWIRRLCQQGRIASWKVNDRLYLVDPNDVAAWFANMPHPGRPKNRSGENQTIGEKGTILKPMIESGSVNQVFMSLSALAVKLALAYLERVNDQEFPAVGTQKGFTVQELDARRRLAHNRLIEQLKKEGIDVSDRAAVTEFAKLLDKWLRED